jgi:hypothetical protein
LILLLAGAAWADQVDPPLENHLFGTQAQGCRGAVVVGAQGIEALFTNPAGILVGTRIQTCAGLLSLAHQRRIAWAGVVRACGPWGLSASWGSTSVGDIPVRDIDGNLTGWTSWRRHRLGVGVARALDFLTYVGGEAHYVRVDAAGAGAHGGGLDFGVVRMILPPLLAVGASLNDVASVLAYTGRAAREETVRPRFTAGVKIGLAEGKIQMEWDLYRRTQWKRWRALVGFQAKMGRGLVARVGYGGGGISAGVGLSSGHVGFGFAMIPDELGNSGRGVEAIWTR